MRNRPLLKFCGLRSKKDVVAALEAGADALGFVLCESPRRVDPEQLTGLLDQVPDCVLKVAVMGAPEEDLVELANRMPFDAVQCEWRRDKSPELGGQRFLLPSFRDGTGTEKEIAAYRKQLTQRRTDNPLEGCIVLDGPTGGGRGIAPDTERASRIARSCNLILAGGLNPENVHTRVATIQPFGVDVSSGIERTRGQKDPKLMQQFSDNLVADPDATPTAPGRFGEFGGCYFPEVLKAALDPLTEAVRIALDDPEFQSTLEAQLVQWVGRPTPLTRASNLGQDLGLELWLKREDLAHTGAHKINNALGQALIAKRMGVARVIAETGAGQHGVATAAACARVGLPCCIYMGAVDVARQASNVARMHLLGAEVVSVTEGDATLRAAINAALREWAADPAGTYYLIGSAVGPHPYPYLVRELQKVIGREARAQVLEQAGALPDTVVACVGGGSNAIGLFHGFLDDPAVELLGAEAGGLCPGQDAATLSRGSKGVLHGAMSLLLQDEHGQVHETHSVSAGLDYPGVGPEHAQLQASGRAQYVAVSDDAALAALQTCTRREGILPALESSHALAAVAEIAKRRPGARVLVGLSGRGDKDVDILQGLGLGGLS